MNVYVLKGSLQYEGDVILGVYTTRENAETAAIKHNDSDYSYYINEIKVDSLAKEYWDGELVEVD